MQEPDIRRAIDEVVKNLSDEEIQKLRSCKYKGFIVGTTWAFGFQAMRHIAVQYNKIKKPTLAANTATFFINVVLGYLTYTPFCATRAIEPLVRKKLGINKQEAPSHTEFTLPMENNTNFQSSLQSDLDGPDPSFSHLSISYEPNPGDNLVLEDEEEKVKPKVYTTYEDLRRQNRESYRAKNLASESINPPIQPVREPIPKRVKTNQYGDPVE